MQESGESRSTIHTRWAEESYHSRNDTKTLSLLDSRAEWNPSALVHAMRRQKYQSTHARSDGQRYPDKILSQVAFVGCRTKFAELSRPADAAWPQHRDGSERIKSIIKQGAEDCFQRSHHFLELVSSAMAKRCWFWCFWEMRVQMGNEFTACFHLCWGYIAPHALKSRFSVEFPRKPKK